MSLARTQQPRALGKSGLTAGPIAWGMWRIAKAGVGGGRRLIAAALAAGVTLFDTAGIYGFTGSRGVDAA